MDTSKKRTISLLLIFTIMFMTVCLSSQSAFAAITIDNDTKIQQISINKLLVSNSNETSTITITEDTENIRKVLVENSDNSNVEFIYDKHKDTVYSSKTGKYVDLSNDYTNELAPLSVVGETKTKKISFAQIKSAVGTAGSLATIAGFLIAGFPGATAAAITMVAKNLSNISALYTLIAQGSENHGIKITMEYYMRSVTKNGKVYKFGDWRPISIGKY